MAYFVADEKLQGYYVSGGVTINIVRYHFECDDAASLPAQTAFISSKKVKISMASTAHTIDTDALYKMDSSGAWLQQSQPFQPLANYSVLSNKPQINGHTLTGNQSGEDLGLQNVLTFDSTPTQNSTNPVTSGGIWTDQQRQDTLQDEDRDALVEIVDGGAKNLVDSASGSGVRWINIPVDLPAGSYTIGFYNISGDDSRDSQLSVYGEDFSGIRPAGAPTLLLAKGNKSYVENVVTTDTMKYIRLYASTNSETSTNKSVNYSVLFVCASAAWKISQSFQPYRPSWQEMYDMILALQ